MIDHKYFLSMSKPSQISKKRTPRPTKRIYIDISKMQESSLVPNVSEKRIASKNKTPRKLPQTRSLRLFDGRISLPVNAMQSLSKASLNSEESPKYKDHIRATLRELQLCARLPIVSMLEIVTRQVTLPHTSFSKCVIFDLDHTLIYSVSDSSEVDALLPVTLPTGETTQIGLKVRPHVLHCLEEVNKVFEVIVFTASQAAYADAILDFIDPSNSLIQHRLYRESCIPVNSVYLKDLRVFLNRKMCNMVIVDNSVLSFANQIDNGIPIRPWEGDPMDRELLYLTQYLRNVADAEDVRDVNRRFFKLIEEPFINLKLFSG